MSILEVNYGELIGSMPLDVTGGAVKCVKRITEIFTIIWAIALSGLNGTVSYLSPYVTPVMNFYIIGSSA